jgi:hypothetical protein
MVPVLNKMQRYCRHRGCVGCLGREQQLIAIKAFLREHIREVEEVRVRQDTENALLYLQDATASISAELDAMLPPPPQVVNEERRDDSGRRNKCG